MMYHCVHCMAPSESTYRKFSREIKLTTCQRCGENVDPYVERDWLLVAMDCILLREEAYRHVLCNRHTEEERANTSTIIWKSMAASALLQGYLLLQENQSLQYEGENNPPSLLFLTLLVQMAGIDSTESPSIQNGWIPLLYFLYAFVGNILFLLGMQITFCLWRKRNASRLSLAILWPTAFHIITVLVMAIWENTTMVRRLASLLVLVYQYWTTTVALRLQLSDAADAPQSRFNLLGVFVAGLTLRALGLAVMRWLLMDYTEFPCLLGVDASGIAGGLFSEGLMHWTICLC